MRRPSSRRVALSLLIVATVAPYPSLSDAATAPGSDDDIVTRVVRPGGEGPLEVRRQRVRGTVTGGFQVSPPQIADTARAGGEIVHELTILNQFGRSHEFTIEVRDLAPGTERGGPQLADRSTQQRSAAHWITPLVDRVTLDNLELAKVPIVIAAPSDVEGGGHYAALVVRATEVGEVNVVTRIVTHVLLVSPGDVRYELELDDVEMRRAGGDAGVVRFTVRNSGNVHSSPRGRIRINGLGTRITEAVDVPQLLPDAVRRIEVRVRGLPLVGTARPTVEVTSENAAVTRARGERIFLVHPGLAALLLLAALLALGWRVHRWMQYRRYLALEMAELDE